MRWFRCAEAARYAGGISEKVLYRAVREGKLRVARIGAGRNILFAEQWIDEWLQATSADTAASTGVEP